MLSELNIKKRGNAVEMVARELRNTILSGKLKPGQNLRQEAIAQELGVSRAPVRDAIRLLESEGLVIVAKNASASVIRLDASELEEIYWLREQLEPAGLVKSLPHLTDEDIFTLRGYIEKLEKVTKEGDLFQWENLDRKFHFLTFTRAQKPNFLRIMNTLWNKSIPYRRAFLRISLSSGLKMTNMEHQLLFDALERRDAADAKSILTMHVRRTSLLLVKQRELFT